MLVVLCCVVFRLCARSGRVVTSTCFKVLKYKILSKFVFKILLSNTSAPTLKIGLPNTKYVFSIVFQIQNTCANCINSFVLFLVDVCISFQPKKYFKHFIGQAVSFRTADNTAEAKQAF